MSSIEENGVIAGILTIGDEVLDGIVLDTNANWLQLQLKALGVEVRREASVRDDIEEIGKGLSYLVETCSLIITSGGLGPTHDDMTLLAISRAFGLSLVEDDNAVEIVKRQYKSLHERGIVASPDLTKSRRKMANLPAGSTPLDNKIGGAPGVMIEHQKTTFFILPGVPSELKSIFHSSVQPWIKKRSKLRQHEQIVIFPQRDESVFAPVIDQVMAQQKGVYIKSMPATYGTTNVLKIWVSARGENEEELRILVADAISSLERASGLSSEPIEPTD